MPGPLDLSAITLCLIEAKRLSRSSSGGELRLAAILADNAVELILFKLVDDFVFHDRWSVSPEWDYDRRVLISKTFEAKVKAAIERGWLTAEQAEIARIGHYIRNGAYHTGELPGDRFAAAWTPVLIDMAGRLAIRQNVAVGLPSPSASEEPYEAVLDLCVTTVLSRIDAVLDGLHEYGNAKAAPMPDDTDLDDLLGTAEAAWGVSFLETAAINKKDDVKAMLRFHVFDGSALEKRQLTVGRLRTWQAEVVAFRRPRVLTEIGPWWRTVDRRLDLYEKTIAIANM